MVRQLEVLWFLDINKVVYLNEILSTSKIWRPDHISLFFIIRFILCPWLFLPLFFPLFRFVLCPWFLFFLFHWFVFYWLYIAFILLPFIARIYCVLSPILMINLISYVIFKFFSKSIFWFYILIWNQINNHH